jgi:hypothetical protein
LIPSNHKLERCYRAADDSRARSRSHASDRCAACERGRRTQWLAAARALHLIRRMCATLLQRTRSAIQMRQVVRNFVSQPSALGSDQPTDDLAAELQSYAICRLLVLNIVCCETAKRPELGEKRKSCGHHRCVAFDRCCRKSRVSIGTSASSDCIGMGSVRPLLLTPPDWRLRSGKRCGRYYVGGLGVRRASVLRFCTIAARWNSSRAPERPRRRIRSKRW